MEVEEVRWGMIGAGEVTEKKSAPAFNKLPKSRLIAVSRRNHVALEDYAQRHQIPFYSNKAQEVIEHPEVNAVYIATPPAAHYDYVSMAAKAGKAVYVEKPMAERYTIAKEMAAVCEAQGVPLFVAYYRRALPNFVKVKQLLEEEVIGKILLVNSRLYLPPRPEDREQPKHHWRIRPELAGGGYLFDMGSHQLDLLDFYFGQTKSLQANARNQAGLYEVADTIHCQLEYESGVMASLNWCFAAAASAQTDRTEMIGSKGRIVFETFNNSPVQVETKEGDRDYAFEMPEHIQQPLIAQIVEELTTGAPTCSSKAENGLRTSRLLDEIVQDYYRLKLPA